MSRSTNHLLSTHLHDWPRTVSEAKTIQASVGSRVEILKDADEPPSAAGDDWDDGLPRLIAGVDASYTRFDRLGFAAVVVWDRRSNTVVEAVNEVGTTPFPYVPGYLSFREGPLVLQAIAKLKARPSVFVFDGQGVAHPKGLGLACHLGAWIGVPSIGIAKSRLTGRYEEPARSRGSRADLLAERDGPRVVEGAKIGTVLRTRDHVQPVFVSPGHLSSHAFAVDVALACHGGRRIPEPTRLADLETKRLRREHEAS